MPDWIMVLDCRMQKFNRICHPGNYPILIEHFSDINEAIVPDRQTTPELIFP